MCIRDSFETAVYSPLLSDWSNYETYTERGSVDTAQRAHKIFYDTVNAHEPPPFDAGRLEEMNAFIDRRIAEGGADIDR